MSVKAKSGRTKIWAAVIVVLLGGGAALWQYLSDPPPAWLAHWKLSQYLNKRANKSDFKIDFPFPSAAEMAQKAEIARPKPVQVIKGPKTGKDFDALSREYLNLKIQAVELDRYITEGPTEIPRRKEQLEEAKKQLAAAQLNPATTNLSQLQTNVVRAEARVAFWEKRAASQSELAKLNQTLEPIVSDLWAIQRAWGQVAPVSSQPVAANVANDLRSEREQLYNKVQRELGTAQTYSAMYTLIGQELWVAEKLFQSKNDYHRRAALAIVFQTCRHARDELQNDYLPARIIEAYVFPNLDLATDENRRSPYSLEGIANECASYFRNAQEDSNVLRSYELMLKHADSPGREDWARSQIAMVQEQAGDYKDAIKTLKQIQATNDFRWAISRIPRLENMLDYK